MPLVPDRPSVRSRLTKPRRASVANWVGGVLVVGSVVGGVALAQVQGLNPPPTASATVATKAPAKPLWRDLSAKQQQALQPLAAHWDTLSEGHKRKWLVLSRNHANLSASEKATLRSRMTEWAALTQQERARARFNFAEVKQVPPDERKAKWEAYQALTPEEKRRLAESAAPRPHGAAPALRPVPAQKLVPIPPATMSATNAGQHGARIQLTPPAEAVAPAPMISTPVPPAEALAPTPVASPPAPGVQPLP